MALERSRVIPLRSDEIPRSLLRRNQPDFDAEPPEPSLADRVLGREIYAETRRGDEREIRRIYNRMED